MRIETLTVGVFDMNAFIVFDEATRTGVVIDPGDEIDRFEHVIRQHGLKITHILLTHGHIDHCGHSEELHDVLRVPMLLHKDDWEMASKVPEQALMFGLPPCRVPEIDAELTEGQVIESGPLRFEVLHTPGHSPGSVTLVMPEAGVAFVGDAIFHGSIGRTDLPGGNTAQLMDAIFKKILTLDDNMQLYSGHGPVTTVGEEKRSNPFLQVRR